MLVDTHCHIHDADYPLDPEATLLRAREAGVGKFICVGTSEQSSAAAVAFAASHSDVYAAVGVHSHDTKDGWGKILELARTNSRPLVLPKQVSPLQVNSGDDSLSPAELAGAQTPSVRQESSPELTGWLDNPLAKTIGQELTGVLPKLVAIGEIGLDYYYNHSPREVQIQALEAQIQIACDYNLPIIFHVREASSAEQRTSVWSDFWPIFDNFSGVKGELHSFTDTQINLEQGLKRGLFIGVNGISTFTKDTHQQQMFANIPLERLLFETDAPFLTPAPKRGNVNEPAFVGLVADYHANVRGMTRDTIAAATTANAHKLFAL